MDEVFLVKKNTDRERDDIEPVTGVGMNFSGDNRKLIIYRQKGSRKLKLETLIHHL